MQAASVPLELRYLHPAQVEAWMADYRASGHSEEGLAGTLSAIKVFANAFVFKQRELCIGDPLRKVSRISPPEKAMPVFSPEELEQILSSFSEGSFESIRNRAFVAVLASTGLRMIECRTLAFAAYDPVAAELAVMGKGDRERYVSLSDRAHRLPRHRPGRRACRGPGHAGPRDGLHDPPLHPRGPQAHG
jgi:site-specific recombinase XerD